MHRHVHVSDFGEESRLEGRDWGLTGAWLGSRAHETPETWAMQQDVVGGSAALRMSGLLLHSRHRCAPKLGEVVLPGLPPLTPEVRLQEQNGPRSPRPGPGPSRMSGLLGRETKEQGLPSSLESPRTLQKGLKVRGDL